MSDKLDSYKAKRDFSATPEPHAEDVSTPEGAPPDPGSAPRFVVQEHHARRLHWDLRLERDGVLASWALPKGVPPDPKVNHLAVPTEDHPLEYLDFAGDIPAGSYGAGSMSIWDRGTYDCSKWDGREVIVTLHGERVSGRYVLFRTGEGRWMIHRMDPPQDPDRVPMPEQLAPMLATASDALPRDDGQWGYEIKWDGVRMIAFVAGGTVKLQGRRLLDATTRYPEIRAIGDVVSSHEVVLDGEVVALDEEGRPSFGLLQQRMNVSEGAALRPLAREVPVVYMLFDLLYLDGRETIGLPYAERRRLLESLSLSGPSWQTPSYHVGDGAALLDATRTRGLEGLVAKRLDSIYRPGRRSASWVKVKNVNRQDLVVGGWLPGQGNRAGRLGALLVGHYEGGDLRYAGRVGSGFTDQELDRLDAVLRPLARSTTPFTAPPDLPPEVIRLGHWVEPTLVAEVAFSEWTHLGTLRAPRYKGMRTDVDPRAVVRESPPTAEPVEDEGMSRELTLGEHRWPAVATVAAVLAIYFALPGRFVLGPKWILPALEAALLIPLTIANPVRLTRQTRATRAISVALIAFISLFNAFSLGLLVHQLLNGIKLGGNSLFLSAGGIWITNVLVFTLWFWELDRGGPVARAFGESPRPDFLFPQMSNPDVAGRDWMPGFVDYFYTSFTNCTAFSPTDTMPLSPWSKLLMLVQAAVSLVTVAVVAARAVNILT